MTMSTGVTTRYYGPTNHRGSRIRVKWVNDAKTMNFDHGANDPHMAAVREAFESWGYTVESLTYVAPSESNRGDVYAVEVTQ